jgi:peptide chain release factor 1
MDSQVEKLLKLLAEAQGEFRKLEEELGAPGAHERPEFAELSRRYAQLREILELGDRLKRLLAELAEEEELLESEEDEGLREELRRAIEEDREALGELAREIRARLVPERPEDRRNAILEIRAGAGGEESALFAADLFRMYSRYAERRGWKVRVLDSHPTPLGGYKQIVFAVEGKGAYGRLRYESGVHRVQRVPVTESGGRIHTSTATVAVLPEAEEVEVEINPDELKFETFRAGGPGGQHMQKNETAVRITHLPTGIVVACQDERSQYRNREQALRILRAKLRDIEERKRQSELRETRRRQIGTGDRSEKIRTYNFPQSRVTDHRIGLTLYRLEDVLDGNLDLVIDPLLEEELSRALEGTAG